MWQDRLRPYAVFTETSEGFAPYYLAGIRRESCQTTAGFPPAPGLSGTTRASYWTDVVCYTAAYVPPFPAPCSAGIPPPIPALQADTTTGLPCLSRLLQQKTARHMVRGDAVRIRECL